MDLALSMAYERQNILKLKEVFEVDSREKSWLSEYERSRKMSKVSVVYWSPVRQHTGDGRGCCSRHHRSRKRGRGCLCFRRKRCRFNRRKKHLHWAAPQWAQKFWKRASLSLLWRALTAAFPARPSHCLVTLRLGRRTVDARVGRARDR